MLNMHHSPAEGNFCDEYGNALKLGTVQDYNRHMGYVDKCYFIGRHIWGGGGEFFTWHF
jgi:hypothetical protein